MISSSFSVSQSPLFAQRAFLFPDSFDSFNSPDFLGQHPKFPSDWMIFSPHASQRSKTSSRWKNTDAQPIPTRHKHPLAGYLSRSHAVQRPKSPSQWEIRTLTTPSHATNIQPVEDLHRCGEFIVKAGRKRPISPCDVIVAHVITACERYSLRNAKPAINGGGSMPMPLGVGGRHPVEAHPVGRPAG